MSDGARARGWTGWVLQAALVAASAGCGSASLKPDGGGGGSGGGGGGGAGGGGGPGAGGSADAAADTSGQTDTGPEIPSCNGTCVVPFVSSSEWSVYDADPVSNPSAQRLGVAQPVCLNASSPPNCPAGAIKYGLAGGGWAVSLATIPGALWLWGPGVSGTDAADLKRYVFVHTFTLGAAPSGSISVAADDSAEVRLNGAPVGTIGSVTDLNQAAAASASLTTLDLGPGLVPGLNTLSVSGQNGPASFAGCSTPCTYSSNPAGVVFGGTLTYH